MTGNNAQKGGDKKEGDDGKAFTIRVRRILFDGMKQEEALTIVVDNQAEQARISDQGSEQSEG